METGPRWDLRRYYIDEAGDPTLFNKHGTVIAGREDCSSHFLIGHVEVDDPAALSRAIEDLRRDLLNDPALSRLPSMQPEARKTAEAFHANKDHPEVKKEVFDLLARKPFRFYAVVRDKRQVLEDLRATQRLFPEFRYSENALYDSMVGRLLRDRLHVEECQIVFARRGKKDRQAAFLRAIESAKTGFADRWGHMVETPQTARGAYPREFAGLQAVDYCLWALQRLIMRGDDSWWPKVASKTVEVVTLDHGRPQDGLAFGGSNPLTLDSWKKLPGI